MTEDRWSALKSAALSLVLIIVGALAVLGAGVWFVARMFMNLLRGEERLYDAYFDTVSANLALAVPLGPGSVPMLARWRSRLEDLRLDARNDWVPKADRARQFSLAPLMAVEGEILAAMSDDMLQARFWALEERFNRVVTPAMQLSWTTHSTKAYNGAAIPIGQMREEACTLLVRIHNTYLLTSAREQAVRALKLFIVVVVLVSIAAAGLIARHHIPIVELPEDYPSPQRLGFVLLFSAGMLGAGVSVVRRLSSAVDGNVLQNDAMMELTGLNLGHAGIAISLLLGGIFAIALYFILWGTTSATAALGSAGQAIFPAFARHPVFIPPCSPQHGKIEICDFDAIRQGLALADAQSLARMLILAFLSGFSERLVPDALDRITNQLDQKNAKKT